MDQEYADQQVIGQPVLNQPQVDTKALELILGNDLKRMIDMIENPTIKDRMFPFILSKIGQNTALSRNDQTEILRKKLQYQIDEDRLMRRIPKPLRTPELYTLLDAIKQLYYENLDRSLNGEERKAINTTISESRNSSTMVPQQTSGGGITGMLKRLVMPQ